MTKSFIISIIILFCAVIVETAILSNITLLPAVPDLVLLCVLYISMMNGKVFGEVSGFISGLFLDFISGVPFGFNCLFRTLIGYIAGYVGKSVNYEGIMMPAVIGFTGTLVKTLLIWCLSLFYPSIIINYNIISIPFLFELVSNTVLAPVVFKFLNSFRKTLIINQGRNA